MSAPYMPLFVADYLADTAHLSAAEHGAYLMLIMNYWQREKPLPADDRKLARIARMSDDEWAAAKPTLAEFFVVEDEWRHARIDQEIAVAQQKSAKAKASARASVAARQANAERPLNDRSADAELLGEDREGKKEPLPESKSSTTNVRSVDKPTRPVPDSHFEEFWKAYPHRGEASDPRKPAKDKFDRAVKRGVDPAAIIAGAKRFAEIEHRAGRAGTEKCAQAVTWLNQERWNDYAAAAQPARPEQIFVKLGTEEWFDRIAAGHKPGLCKFYPEQQADGWYFAAQVHH
jgi:uncharacterized protein YdaU (DUF1376 family)